MSDDYVAKRPHERQKLPGKSVTYYTIPRKSTKKKKKTTTPKPEPKPEPTPEPVNTNVGFQKMLTSTMFGKQIIQTVEKPEPKPEKTVVVEPVQSSVGKPPSRKKPPQPGDPDFVGPLEKDNRVDLEGTVTKEKLIMESKESTQKIIPTETYLVDDKYPMPGSLVKAKLESEHSEFVEDIDVYPPGTRFKKDPSGSLKPVWDEQTAITWGKQHLKFDDPYTKEVESVPWSELKKEHPSLYLHYDKNTFYVKDDPVRWQREQDKKHAWWDVGYQATKVYGWAAGQTERFYEHVTGHQQSTEDISKEYRDPFGYHHKRLETLHATEQYSITQKIRKEDWVGVGSDVFTKTPVGLVSTYGIGYGMGMFSKTATGATKVFNIGKKGVTLSKVVNVGMGSTFAITTGAGIASSGFDRDYLSRLAVSLPIYGAVGHSGYKAGANWKPVTGVKAVGDTLYFQKHVTTFRGKPILPYGKKIFVSRYSSGIVAGPKGPGWGAVKFQTPQSFMKNTLGFGEMVRTSQVVPYKPSGLAPYYAPKYGYMPPVGKPVVYSSQWGQKMFVETGQGWQPKISNKLVVRPPSSLVPTYGDIPSYITESESKLLPFVSKTKWQPSTGLDKPVSEIKDVNELFKIYKQNKITTETYQKYRDLLMRDTEVTISKHPLAKPPINVKPKPISYPSIVMDATKEGVISTEWYGKEYLSGSKGWQPKISRVPSTQVWPKPKLFRSYETYYRFVTFYKPLYVFKPKSVKTFKGVKDIIKSDTQISKETGGIQTGQRQVSITKQKQDNITKQISKTETLTIPEQLLKPVIKYKTYQLQKPVLENQFKGLSQIYKQQQISLQKQANTLLYGQSQAQSQSSVFSQTQAQRLKLGQKLKYGLLVGIGQTQGQTQGQEKVVGVTTPASSIYTYHLPTPITVVPKTPATPKPPIKLPPTKIKTPRGIVLPDFEGKTPKKYKFNKKWYDVGYRFRVHKTPDIMSLISKNSKKMLKGGKR